MTTESSTGTSKVETALLLLLLLGASYIVVVYCFLLFARHFCYVLILDLCSCWVCGVVAKIEHVALTCVCFLVPVKFHVCVCLLLFEVGVRQLCEHNFSNNRCCFALKIMQE